MHRSKVGCGLLMLLVSASMLGCAITARQSPVAGVTFSKIETNGITMRVARAGTTGPMVLLVHGWPESWYAWRHQLTALADAGYRVVAPDMRGYGKTDAPPNVEDYDIYDLTADMVGVLDALGEETATIVGHDWGAIVAQYSALFYPERFTSLALMSVPYAGRGPVNPIEAMRDRVQDNFFYIVYHNEPGGVAEAEYDSDPRGLLSRLYLSPDSPRQAPEVTNPKRSAGGWIPRLGAPLGLPDWLSQQDLDYIVGEFEAAGFRGGVNYYRNFGRNWELTAEVDDFTIKVPTTFIAGSQDVVIGGASAAALTQMMQVRIPDLRGVHLIPGIGHWVQQEAPEKTNALLLEFLRSL